MRRSKDLLHWELLGPVFTTPPAWIPAALGITPATSGRPTSPRAGGEYRLYYAASQFGTNNSVIGLATTQTLDPASPDYGWVDRGMVLRSTPGADDFNAIDPDVVVDARRRPVAGVRLVLVGHQAAPARPGHRACRRRRPDALRARLAAAGAVDRGRRRSCGTAASTTCSRASTSAAAAWTATTALMVGRATSVTGPVPGPRRRADARRAAAPSCCAATTSSPAPAARTSTATCFVHHYYDRDDDGVPKLSVRPLRWRAGWPALGDPLSGSRELGHGPAYLKITERRERRARRGHGLRLRGRRHPLAAATGAARARSGGPSCAATAT